VVKGQETLSYEIDQGDGEVKSGAAIEVKGTHATPRRYSPPWGFLFFSAAR